MTSKLNPNYQQPLLFAPKQNGNNFKNKLTKSKNKFFSKVEVEKRYLKQQQIDINFVVREILNDIKNPEQDLSSRKATLIRVEKLHKKAHFSLVDALKGPLKRYTSYVKYLSGLLPSIEEKIFELRSKIKEEELTAL